MVLEGRSNSTTTRLLVRLVEEEMSLYQKALMLQCYTQKSSMTEGRSRTSLELVGRINISVGRWRRMRRVSYLTESCHSLKPKPFLSMIDGGGDEECYSKIVKICSSMRGQ